MLGDKRAAMSGCRVVGLVVEVDVSDLRCERAPMDGGWSQGGRRTTRALGGGRRVPADGARRARRGACARPRWWTARVGGRRSAGEARRGTCARRQEARCRVRSQDARADKIGKVEGIEEGMTVSLFPSTHDGGMRTHGGRAGRK